MTFSDTSNKTGIVEDITFLTGADTNLYPLVDRARNVNRWYHAAAMAAWEASDDWEFDDSNQTDFPIATTTLVESQPDYSLPSNALSIQRVEVKSVSGDWQRVHPIDETEVSGALDEFMETDGLPQKYRMVRNAIVLYPAPTSSSATLASGLKIYFFREVDEFASTDTTQEPGIAEPFHRILSLGAAYDYCVAYAQSKAPALRVELDALMQALRTYYSGRHEEVKPRLRVRHHSFI